MSSANANANSKRPPFITVSLYSFSTDVNNVTSVLCHNGVWLYWRHDGPGQTELFVSLERKRNIQQALQRRTQSTIMNSNCNSMLEALVGKLVTYGIGKLLNFVWFNTDILIHSWKSIQNAMLLRISSVSNKTPPLQHTHTHTHTHTQYYYLNSYLHCYTYLFSTQCVIEVILMLLRSII